MIYLLLSPQSKIVRVYYQKLVKKILPERNEMNCVSFDMGTSLLRDVAEECSYVPLGYDKKVVVAENCYFLEFAKEKPKFQKDDRIEDLIDYFSHPNPDVDLFLFVYSDKLAAKSEFYTALLQGGVQVREIPEYTEEQWLVLIPNYMEKRGVQIDRDAVAEFHRRVGGDYALFLNEAKKLITYANGERITLKTVEELVSPPIEDDAFELSNALLQKDKRRAMLIHEDLTIKNTEPIIFIRLLTKQFRFLNEVLYLKNQGYSKDQIAAALKATSGRIYHSLKAVNGLSK
ncbi:MAG: DNA polymerase III subunit delta, partial [Bacilli bacterium]|nr:DNA polymerase III subunit delta [Bacilli bacterium]